ncbi:MAG: DUF2868 domain-containing protein [bacterium]|nr:DUF2868 domain-containing protein [bacterium]
MNDADAARVLLVHAVETEAPALTADVQAAAFAHAGHVDDEAAWLVRRASFLVGRLPPAVRALEGLARAPGRALWVLVAAGLVLGAVANSFGPSGAVSVLWNPLLVLVAWNVLVVVLGPLVRVAWRRRPRATPPAMPALRGSLPRLPWLVRRVLSPLWPAAWMALQRERAAAAGLAAAELRAIAERFWASWRDAAAPLLGVRTRLVLHAGALALVVGAIAGVYVRGVFLQYDVVWRSTFVRDPEGAGTVVRLVLGPAALLAGRTFTGPLDPALLLRSEGAPAAPWIHLFALTALLFAVLPRLVAAALSAASARRQAAAIAVPLDADWVRALVQAARRRERWLRDLRDGVVGCVDEAARATARSLAQTACEELFDGRIAPALAAFRVRGGRIADLEADVHARADAYGATLAAHAEDAHDDFVRAVQACVVRRGGSRLDGEVRWDTTAPQVAAPGVGMALATDVADLAGAAASIAAAPLGAALGGGGGLALLAHVHLLAGVAGGPIGLVLGGVGGLVVAGAGWWLGRDWIGEKSKNLHLPPAALRALLPSRRLETLLGEAREQYADALERTVRERLAAAGPSAADAVVRRLEGRLAPDEWPDPGRVSS